MSILNNLTSAFKRYQSKVLQPIIDAMDQALLAAVVASDDYLLELVLDTSTGEWLDEWGSWFSISRTLGEEDAPYRARIKSAVTKPKTTIPSLIDTVRLFLGKPDLDVQIIEPYKNAFTFNRSVFSGDDRYADGTYTRTSVVDIIIPASIPPGLMDVLNLVKAAGVKIYLTRILKLNESILTFVHRVNSYIIERETDITPTNFVPESATLEVDRATEYRISMSYYTVILAGDGITLNSILNTRIDDLQQLSRPSGLTEFKTESIPL